MNPRHPLATANRTRKSLLAVIWVGGVAAVSLSGCGPSVDPKIASLRSELLLAERPADTIGILDAKEQLKNQATELATQDVVLAAQVTTGEYAFWDPENAMFAVSEIIEEEPGHGGAGHDASKCPFCNRKLAALRDRRAMVKVVDESGEVLPIEARELLGIEEGQRLVVLGEAQVDKNDNLIVLAKRLFIDG